MKRLIAMLLVLAAPFARAGETDAYFHAIHCKAIWSELTAEEKDKVPGTDAAIAAIHKILKGYVASGAKTAGAIDADISDFKAYLSFEPHHLNDWRACVAHYAPAAQ